MKNKTQNNLQTVWCWVTVAWCRSKVSCGGQMGIGRLELSRTQRRTSWGHALSEDCTNFWWAWLSFCWSNEKTTPFPPHLNKSVADQCSALQNSVTLFFKSRAQTQWTEKWKQGDVIRKQKERETGSGAQLRREWLLEVGHSSIDVKRSDVQSGTDSRHCLRHLLVLHTHTLSR